MIGMSGCPRVRALVLLFLSAVVVFACAAGGWAKALPEAAAGDGGRIKLWVFFDDKGLGRIEIPAAIDAFESTLAPKALWRRAKVGLEVNVNDLPVSAEYVRSVQATGATIVTRSRWLNAVSVYADDAQAARIAELPFVLETRPVARAAKELPDFTPAAAPAAPSRGTRLDYGPAYGQLDQIQVTDLHDAGFDGSGVIIAMLDTGFDTSHQAYHHLDLIAEHDFINDDDETANEPGDPDNQDSHGTATLSCVGGVYPGQLYGGSYEASFILCKTERVDVEIEVEEDYWVEAIEWADSLGADVASSSLGYFYWYTYEDMDGNTAVTTIAADMAAARGIVVVNSMGNEGDSDWRYMIAPADGDSVVSLGAVNSDGVRVSFSSVGPTYDGRIKPDVMAQGRRVYVASSSDTAAYSYSSGTSFSCPLTSGAVGLLLEGHPEWTPADVIEALHETATQSAAPDTLMGWGILQAYDAMYSSPQGVEAPSDPVPPPVISACPNPFFPGAVLECSLPAAARVSLAIYDPAGRLVRTLVDGARPAGPFSAAWDGTDARGAAVANGVYFARIATGRGTAASKITMLR